MTPFTTDKERLAALETTTTAHEEKLQAHAEHLQTLDKTLTTLVGEVKLIRVAITVMALSLAPSGIREVLGLILGIK
jgi:hypothetical protein